MFNVFAKNIQKYLIVYSLIILAIGWILGILYSPIATNNASLFKNLVNIFVFFMIYPMMVRLNVKLIPKIIKKPKAIGMSLIYNYILTPVIALILAYLFLHNVMLSLGFMLVMLIPGATPSIGYTGIVDGSIETATIAQTLNFLLIPILTPIYLSFMVKNVTIPTMMIIQSILLLIVLPMALGILTRILVTRFMGKKGLEKINSFLSTITTLFMFGVIGIIFFMKGDLLVKQWGDLLNISIVTFLYVVIMLLLVTFVDKLVKLSYKEHMGIVFLSSSKNTAIAIAIATMAFNPLAAIPAVILRIFQIILIVYIQLAGKIKRYFGYVKT